MIRRSVIVGVGSVVLALGAGYAIRAAWAGGIPATNALTYVGLVENGSGPVSGMHNIQVALYDAVTAGDLLCQTASTSTMLTNGRFSLQLPNSCATAIGAHANTWVDVLVDGGDTGRTMVEAVPYAIEANHAVNADNATGALATTVAQMQTNITALQTKVAALEAAPAPLTEVTITDINPSAGFAAECFGTIPGMNGGNYGINDSCLLAATYTCIDLGYKGGWLTGNDTNVVEIACIK
jgi:hypothetical protein